MPDEILEQDQEPIDVVQEAQLGRLPDNADESLEVDSIPALEKKLGCSYL